MTSPASTLQDDAAPRSSDGPMGRGARGPEASTYGDDLDAAGVLLTPFEGDPTAERRVAAANLQIWTDYHESHAKRLAAVRVNELRREGYPNVMLRRGDGERTWRAWMPEGATPDSEPAMNKAATLCRRMVSILFADPPVAQVEPPSAEDEDVARAEAATRLLHDVQGDTGLRSQAKARYAMDLACTHRSAFERFYIDPKGGGLQPVTIEASPDAQTVEDATRDPQTGEARPGPFVSRYVRRDGSLTDHKWEAAQEWTPGVKSELLTLRHVHLLPHTCEDLEDADGVQVGTFQPWSRVEAMFPDAVARLSEEDRQHIFAYRPERAEDLVPDRKRDLRTREAKGQQLVFLLTTYFRAGHADYPEGCYVITLADRLVCVQETLLEEAPDGEVLALDIPLTQYRQFREGVQDPYGFGVMDILGPGGELRWNLIGSALDHFEKHRQRRVFLPTSSTLNAKDLLLPTRTVLPINPGGQPIYEDLPDYPHSWDTLIQMASSEMDSDSGLQQAAQGVEDPSVQSAKHAQTIIQQVHAGLSEISQSIAAAWVRGSRITLQLTRLTLDRPRVVKFTGDDGRHRARAFESADLRDTSDIRIKVGTNTMLAPTQKADLARQYASDGVLSGEELRDILTGQVGGLVGAQDNPFRLRIKRQLADWVEGPPEGWLERLQAAAGQAQAQGLQPQFDPTQDPALAAIWMQSPADTLPQVAPIRLYEIAKMMSSTRYERKPPEWRAGIDAEFMRLQGAMMALAQPAPGAPQPGGQAGPAPG